MAYPHFAFNGNSQYFELPYSNEVEIILPFDNVELDDGTTQLRDYGQQYDKRISKFNLLNSISTQENINDFIYNISRANTIQLYPGSEGWFPFGPDKGKAGPFDVSVFFPVTPKINLSPLRYFDNEIIITNVGSYPAYNLPEEIDDGTFQIGTVENLHMPQNLFDAKQRYSISINHTENSTPYYFDRGENADVVTTTFIQQCNQTKAAALLYYLTNTIRSNPFNIYSQYAYYIFGIEHDDNVNFSVQLNTNKIKITQLKFDSFEIELNIKRISTL